MSSCFFPSIVSGFEALTTERTIVHLYTFMGEQYIILLTFVGKMLLFTKNSNQHQYQHTKYYYDTYAQKNAQYNHNISCSIEITNRILLKTDNIIPTISLIILATTSGLHISNGRCLHKLLSS